MGNASSRILVVEGDPNLGLALELLFSQHGYQVEVVRSGELALDRLAGFAPHLVVIEAHLPFRSSYDICQTILRLVADARPRILLLTVKERETEMTRSPVLGIDAVLTKPFSSRQMLDTVGTLLA